MPNYERYSREDVDARQLFRPVTDAEETVIIERKRAAGDMLPHYDLPQAVCVVCGKMMKWRGRPRHGEMHQRRKEAESLNRFAWSTSLTYLRMPTAQEMAEWETAELARWRQYDADTAAIKAVEDARDAVVDAALMLVDAQVANPHQVKEEMQTLRDRVAVWRVAAEQCATVGADV